MVHQFHLKNFHLHTLAGSAVVGFALLLLLSCEDGSAVDEEVKTGESTSVSQSADWPVFRGDSEMQGVSSEDLPAELKLAWTYEAPVEEGKRRPPIEASPVIADGIIFVGTQDSKMLAIQAEGGLSSGSLRLKAPLLLPLRSWMGISILVIHTVSSMGSVPRMEQKCGGMRLTERSKVGELFENGIRGCSPVYRESRLLYLLFCRYDG